MKNSKRIRKCGQLLPAPPILLPTPPYIFIIPTLPLPIFVRILVLWVTYFSF